MGHQRHSVPALLSGLAVGDGRGTKTAVTTQSGGVGVGGWELGVVGLGLGRGASRSSPHFPGGPAVAIVQRTGRAPLDTTPTSDDGGPARRRWEEGARGSGGVVGASGRGTVAGVGRQPADPAVDPG